eukprot:TRINITY_DN6101_c0_g1_i1.p1 TRINITY_DN6101_c0_g1~~TRINITY_DN6101_c0_g1_i1.p1  ORF type:complete len:351 (-),score=58.69 TRINITY_DN6101_c0_g1_i1:492-1544(-)
MATEDDSKEKPVPLTIGEIFPARIVRIGQETPTVRILDLKVDRSSGLVPESFGAGQWVDFHIAGISQLGGFSICSSPTLLQQHDIIQLAIKWNHHNRPARWVHEQASEGHIVSLQIGGTFLFNPHRHVTPSLPASSSSSSSCLSCLSFCSCAPPPSPPPPVPALLLAGGIGINPLLSMARHVRESYPLVPITVLYCARSARELAFWGELEAMRKGSWGRMEVQYFLTRHKAEQAEAQSRDWETELAGVEEEINPSERAPPLPPHLQQLLQQRLKQFWDQVDGERIHYQRPSPQLLTQHLQSLCGISSDDVNPTFDAICYLCGPPAMVDSSQATLLSLGVPSGHILFERWW